MTTSENMFLTAAIYLAQVVSKDAAFAIGFMAFAFGLLCLYLEWKNRK